MITSIMLERPRSLPKRLRRSVSPELRKFAKKRHKRVAQRNMERWRRLGRRTQRMLTDRWKTIRRTLLISALVILVCVFMFILFSPIIQVREIQVQRTDTRVDIEKVQRALAPLFGRHLLFLPPYEVGALLSQSFPDLQAVDVKKSYPSRLIVKLELRPIVARLIIEEPAPTVTESGATVPKPPSTLKDYLTDNGIYVVSPLTYSGGLTITIRDWTLKPVPGTTLVTTATFNFLREAEASLQHDLSLHSIQRIVYIRARELHLKVGKIILWFDTESPLAPQMERLKQFMKVVPLSTVREYVDLRLSGKVIYK